MVSLTESIPCAGSYDVIVAGGGVAGCAAALSAARSGCRVALLEKSVKLGGLATLGLINYYEPVCNGRGKRIITGMAEEMLSLCIRYGYGDIPEPFAERDIPAERLAQYREAGQEPPRLDTVFSAELFALALTDLLVREGVSLHFDTLITRTVPDGEDPHRVAAIVTEDKAGRRYYEAGIFIDATGDADVLRRAGVPTLSRGNFHTYMAFEVNLDTCRRAVEAGDIRLAHKYVNGGFANLWGKNQPEDVALYDGTDPDDVNRYLIDNQRELLMRFADTSCRKERDIVTLPGMPQFRTTRCLDADYVLQEDDVYRHFADSVGAICDFHYRDRVFEVPYRTLVKTGFPNLITAGRSAAAKGYAWDVLRVIPPAILTGQAAGLAAAQALRLGRALPDIDITALQKALTAGGVTLHFDDGDIPA